MLGWIQAAMQQNTIFTKSSFQNNFFGARKSLTENHMQILTISEKLCLLKIYIPALHGLQKIVDAVYFFFP